MTTQKTFIIDCPWCKAKVAAIEHGRGTKTGWIEVADEPYGITLVVGECPNCGELLAGQSHQVGFAGHDDVEDDWSDVVRIFPKPPKAFSSDRIPKVVRDSILEADKSLQANANLAACAMLGRALEGVCRDVMEKPPPPLPPGSTSGCSAAKRPKPLMLGQGIKELKEAGVIDERLFSWSQELHAFRNLAAHPEDAPISRSDVEDLQTFVYAIIEYIYDLTDRYEEFKQRLARSKKKT